MNTITDFNTVIEKLFNGNPALLDHIQENDFNIILDIAKKREDEKYFLKPLKTIALKAYDGTKNLCQVKEMFPGYHDDDLKNWNLDEAQTAGTEMKLKVSEMQPGKDGTFQKIFNGDDPSIWIPQNRILQVIEEHEDEMLKNGNGNLFPVKRKDGTRFVVGVHWRGGKRYVNVYEFENDNVCSGDRRHRVFTAEVS